MLLSEGHCVYYGHATEALLYFAKLGHTCPKDFNPADFLLETISIDQRSEVRVSPKCVKLYMSQYMFDCELYSRGHFYRPAF